MKKKYTPEREVGFSEGIDNEQVAKAFTKLQNWPQFKLIRKIPLISISKETKPSDRILDYGCGSGHLLRDIHRKLNKKSHSGKAPEIYGLDISKVMLNNCNSYLHKHKIDNIKLLQGDGTTIPVEDEYFGVVVSSLSLHHWKNPIQTLNEIFRVIKSGGSFILFDFHRSTAKIWFKFLRFITKRIVPRALRKANEPLGSLMASYTINEIDDLESKLWENYQIECSLRKRIGPFIRVVYRK